jgi:Methyltransferase domain
MSSAQQHYVRSGMNQIEGWFHRLDAEIFCLLTGYQNTNALGGSVAEIGLHHGKSFIAMCLSLRDGQRAYGIDLFERQSLNVDHSGRGDRGILERNLAAAGVDRSRVILDARDSISVRRADILDSVGAVRFFSVDGGHLAEVVRNDLALAEQTLAEHGVIALDDFLRPEWPDVSTGFFAWFEKRATSIVPFAIGFNKLYLCHQGRLAAYMEVLRRSEFLKFFLSKHYKFCGNEIPVFQEFVQHDWGWRRRVEEHVKIFHPDLYVHLKSVRFRSRFLRR